MSIPLRTSGEPIPSSIDLFQQGVDFLAAAEFVARAGRDEIIDAATFNALFAVRLLIRAALGERDLGEPNLSIADLFERLDPAEQSAIMAQADMEQELEPLPLDRVRADITTWLGWHQFLEQPKGNRDRAEFYIKLGRGLELYLLDRNRGWAGRNAYRDAGPLARSVPLSDREEDASRPDFG